MRRCQEPNEVHVTPPPREGGVGSRVETNGRAGIGRAGSDCPPPDRQGGRHGGAPRDG